MVAIVTGTGLGLENTSVALLGARGQVGQAALGRSGEQVYVNGVNGNLIIRDQDQMLIGTGPDGVLGRAYNTANPTGWRMGSQRSVAGLTGTVNTTGSTITRTDWDGSQSVYAWSVSRNAYVSTAGVGAYDALTLSGSTWTWTDGDTGAMETYDNANGGRLTSAIDADGNVVTYSYNASGQLSRVTTAGGEYTDLIYTGALLTQMTTTMVGGQTSTGVRYGYDASNRLTTVTVDLSPNDNSVADGKTYVTTYGYGGNGAQTTQVSQISRSDGSKLAIYYGADGLVSRLDEQGSFPFYRSTTLAYDAANRVTTITDPAGLVTKLYYNVDGQLIQALAPPIISGDAATQSQTFSYNANGDVTSITLPGGETTTYEYDANGNRILERDAAGVTITRTFDAKNKLLTETRYATPDPDGAGAGQPSTPLTTRYVYDAESHLRFVISAEGRVSEYRYNTPGQVVSAIDYVGNLYDVSALGVGAAPTEATVNAWVAAIADKSNTQRTDTTYDFRGNVSTVIRFGKVLSSGLGDTTATTEISRTTYVYDQNGRLLSRLPDGASAAEVFVYDGLGRVISSTDLAGSTTSIAFNDAGGTTVVTLANGKVQTSVYNLYGERISYSESGPDVATVTWTYDYDVLGRLGRTTDPNGIKTYFVYDGAGRKVTEINDGVSTEYRYNIDNSQISKYVVPGKKSSINDSNFTNYLQHTQFFYSFVPSSTWWNDANAQLTWNIYDAAQRLVETIDGAGKVTTYAYDGASRLVATKTYTNVLAAATVTRFKSTPPTTVQLPTANATDRVSRLFYDKDGRQIGVLNADGYLTETLYDGAGRKIETIAYAAATTASLRAMGTFTDLRTSVTATANPADIHNWFVYDGRGLLRAAIDGEGDLTWYYYNAQGDLDHTVTGQRLDLAALRATRPTLANLASFATTPTPSDPPPVTPTEPVYTPNLLGWTIEENNGLSAGEKVYLNAARGELGILAQDQLLAGTGLDGLIGRTYTGLGSGWRSDLRYVTRLTGAINTTGSTVDRTGGDGLTIQYRWSASRNAYVATGGGGAYDTLTLSGSTWTWTDGDTGAVETYDNANGGRLTSVVDADGNLVTYGYNASGQLSRVTTASGEYVDLIYTGALLTQMTTTAGGQTSTGVRYGYDTSNRLTTVTVDLTPGDNSIADGKTYVTTYAYGGNGAQAAQVSQITESDGSKLVINYGSDGRVSSYTQFSASGVGRTTTLVYDTVNRVTTITDPAGQATKLYYDADGQLTQTLAPPASAGSAAQSQTLTYNANGAVTSVTLPGGETTTYGYDANGNRILERDAAGLTITRTFDAKNKLLTETRYLTPDPDGAGAGQPSTPLTTRYVYDAESHLRFVISAEGRVTEYRYNTPGQVVSAIDYAGNLYSVAALGVTDAPTEATVNAWVTGITDKSNTQRTDTTYDFRGNVSTVIQFGKVLSSGLGDTSATTEISKTTYVYDQAGRLLSRLPDGASASEVFVYDGLGRVISSTDLAGSTTSIAFNDASSTTVVTLANGLVRTTVYNLAGELVSVSESGPGLAISTWTRDYDSLGRLRRTTDPTGIKTYLFYDNVGRKTAEIDGDGTVTEYRYNADNLLVGTVRHAVNIQDRSAYDAAVGSASYIFTLPGGIAGSADQWSWNVYDAAQRLVETIDAAGSVTTFAYDGASRLVATKAYANVLSVATINGFKTAPPTTPQLPADAATDRVSRLFYDKDGRQVAALDAEGYLTEAVYDGAGRKIETIAYATATTASLRVAGTLADLKASVTATANPADIHNWLVYDARGLLRATIDGEGDLIRYHYTPLGDVDQKIVGQKLDVAALLVTRPTLANLPAAPADVVLETTTYARNLLGWVITETKALSGGLTEVTTYGYDKAGNVISAVTSTQGSSDVRGVTRDYDARGRLIRSLSGEGAAALALLANPTAAQIDAVYATYGETYAYDAADRLIAKTSPNGADASAVRTLYYYNADGRLVYQINPLGEVVEYRYDALGRATDTIVHGAPIAGATLATLTGGLVNAAATAAVAAIANTSLDSASHVDYDVRGLVTQSVDAMGSATTYAYNAFGEVVSTVAPLDGAATVQTTLAYDRRGLLLSTTRDAAAGGLQLVTASAYDAFGRQTRFIDAKLGATVTDYDRAGRTITATDAMGLSQTFTYDGRGNVLTFTDRTRKTTTYAYTAFNRQITVTTPEGIVSTSLVNAYGQTISLTDGAGQVTTYAYDKNGALTSTTDAAGTQARHYDKAGRLADVVDAAGVKTSFTFDAANRVLTRKVDDGGLNLLTTYAYDAKGQQVSVTDPKGQVTTTAYDKAGRQTTVVLDPAGLAITTTYAYDKAGRVLTVTGPTGLVTQYTYDAADRRTKTQVDPAGLNLATTYVYDQNGNAIASTAPDGAVTRYVYDADNRLTWTIDAIGAATNTTYDGEGRVASVRRYANPAVTLAGSTLPLTVADVTAAVSTAARDDVTIYVYDGDGRLRFTLDGTLTSTRYAYDAAGNLLRRTQFSVPVAPAATYTVDYLEAQIASTGMSPPTAYKQIDRMVYDAANRLAFLIDGMGGVTAYTYDLAGNVAQTRRYETAYTTTGDPSVAAMQAWSAGLTGTQIDDDQISRVVYDAAGRAAYGIDAMGVVTAYGYDQAGRVVRTRVFETAYSGAGVPTLAAMQSWAAGLGGVQIDDDRVGRTVYDAAGRVAFTIDAAGLVVAYSYDAAGHVTAARRYETAYTNPADPTLATMQAWSAGLSGTLVDDDRISRTVYDTAGRVAYQVDAEGYVTETRYDTAGRVAQSIRYADRYAVTDTTTKASLATLIGVPQNSPAVTRYAYDAAGRLIEVTNPEGVVTRQTLDALGLVTDVYAAAGTSDQAVTHRTYDVLGRLASETLGYGTADASTTYSYYDGLGRLTKTVNGRGFATDYTYDVVGRMRSKTVALAEGVSATTTYEYDAFGNQVKVTDPRGFVGLFYYDKLDRLALQVDPMGGATEYAYSLGGALIQVKHYGAALSGTPSPATRPIPTTGPGDAVTQIVRDKLDRVIASIDAMGKSEVYQLNAFGDRVAVTNRLGGTTYNTFDKRGLLRTETLPIASYRTDGSVEATSVVNRYEYDSRGNRILSIEAEGLAQHRTTTYAYDKLDRLISQTGDSQSVLAPDWLTGLFVAPTQTFKYDKRGNLIETVDPVGARTLYYYDALDRKTGQIDAVGALSTWQYDQAGNAIAAVVYGDPVSQPAAAGGTRPNPVNAGNYRLTTYDYDRNNRLIATTVAGLRTGQMVGDTYVTQIGSVTTRIEYDAMGNVVRQTDGRGGDIFSYYDGNGRKLAEVDQENYLTLYQLDSNGNVLVEERLALRLPAPVTTATTVASLRLAVRDANDRRTDFTYDLNGRRLTETRQNVNFGQVSFTLANGTATGGSLFRGWWYSTITYTYNGLGQVVTKTQATADTEKTTYTYDLMGRLTNVAGPQLSDIDATLTSHQVTTYYDGLNNVVRTREGRSQTDAATDRITRYVYDASGHLYASIDATGFTRIFNYDANGHVVRELYYRVDSNGNQFYDAKIYGYDALGRLVTSGTANYDGVLTFGDRTNLRYDVFGELTGRGVSAGTGPVTYQETYEYDAGGRMWRSNTGDGVTRLYIYDGAGAATLTVDPVGANTLAAYANLEAAIAGIGAAAFTGMGASGAVTPTLTIYDKRGQAVETRETFRQYSSADLSLTTTQRRQTVYNAFGEVVRQIDPRGATVDFSYNTLGKLTKKQGPTVSVTNEAGVTYDTRPTEEYWYDLAGRMVASIDANGGTTMRWLLNGTGYDGVDALATIEMQADNTVVLSTYDVFRDLRLITNELGAIESRSYDKMGRLTLITRPMRSTADGGTQLSESYSYDGLGQRLAHWNSQLGAAAKETTDYDLQGRVTRQTDMAGYATTYAYAYDATLTTTGGLGTFGGWTKTTMTVSGKTSTDRTDLFGHLVSHVDLGGHVFTYDYDRSGSLVRETEAASAAGGTLGIKTYAYLNTGLLGSIVEQVDVGDDHMTGTTTYAYDQSGNRTAESYAERRWGLRVSYSWRPSWLWDDYYYEPITTTEAYDNTIVYRSATASYDALGRMTNYADGGEGGTQSAVVSWKYDAVGNVRNVHAVYGSTSAPGALGLTTQDQWFRYDTMNRMVTSKGVLQNGAIVRGYQGTDLQYDAAGQRVAAITTTRQAYTVRHRVYDDEDPSIWHWESDIYPYDADRIETYSYTSDGYLSQVRASITVATLNGTTLVVTPAGTPTVIQQDRRDAMGRLIDHVEYSNGDSQVTYSEQTDYDNASNVIHSKSSRFVQIGVTQDAETWTYYGADGASGAYQGVATYSLTSNVTRTNGVASNAVTSDTRTSYVWWDAARQQEIQVRADVYGAPNAINRSYFAYDTTGKLSSVSISDGRPRTVAYTTDAMGQVLSRKEADNDTTRADPVSYSYWMEGHKIGETGNDGSSDLTWAETTVARAVPKTGPFSHGLAPTAFGDFDQGYVPINPETNNGGKADSRVTVRSGDSLRSIAESLWGDASLWWVLAEANGLPADGALTAGQTLVVPAKVINARHTAETFRPYDPNKAIGEVSPTTPQPVQALSAKAKKGCGTVGTILTIVIAVAVAYVTAGQALWMLTGQTSFAAAGLGASVAAGAIGGAVGSIASQAFAIAVGQQDKFSWKGVALSAIGGGVAGGLAGVRAIQGLAETSKFAAGVVRGAAGSVITQGIAVATGLQDKFDWTGVAVGAVVGGVSASVNAAINSHWTAAATPWTPAGLAGGLVSGAAAAVAGAATRSLIDGSDFGDNVVRSLPDVVGSTIGNAITGWLDSRSLTPVERKYGRGAFQLADSGQIANDASGSSLQPDGRGGKSHWWSWSNLKAKAASAWETLTHPSTWGRKLSDGIDYASQKTAAFNASVAQSVDQVEELVVTARSHADAWLRNNDNAFVRSMYAFQAEVRRNPGRGGAVYGRGITNNVYEMTNPLTRLLTGESYTVGLNGDRIVSRGPSIFTREGWPNSFEDGVNAFGNGFKARVDAFGEGVRSFGDGYAAAVKDPGRAIDGLGRVYERNAQQYGPTGASDRVLFGAGEATPAIALTVVPPLAAEGAALDAGAVNARLLNGVARSNVLPNVAESQAARASSNFAVYAAKENALLAAEVGPVTQSIGDIRSLGLKDAHHVIQDAAVRDLPGYNTRLAPGVQLAGPSTLEGSPHYNATQAQRIGVGGTYGAERQIAYDALRAAGHTDAQATQALREADAYFDSIGVTEKTPTRIPGNRSR